MSLVWNPWTIGWLVKGIAFATLGVLAYRARPWRLQNRALALALFTEGLTDFLIVLQFSTTSPTDSRAFLHAAIPPSLIVPVAYVLFLSTFGSPLARPLQSRFVRRALITIILVAPIISLGFRDSFTTDVQPLTLAPWNPNGGAVLDGLVFFGATGAGLFGLAVIFSALRRTPPGSAARSRLSAYAIAFLWRDVGWVVAGLVFPTLAFGASRSADAALMLYPLYEVVFALLLGYGMVRHEAFGVEVRLRGLLPAGGVDRAWLDDRRREVYRAALEAAAPSVTDDPREQALLARLRDELHIGDEEHHAMLAAVRDTRVRFGAERRGRFRVERELGAGGEGRVYLARDIELDRPVVLKEPLVGVDGRWRLVREARMAARVRHPNVVSVHEVIADAEPPLLVLEYVPGGTLQDALERDGAWPVDRVARLGIDILSGLERIHAEGIVHGDVKPANILIDEDGTAKLSDFGISAALAEGGPSRGTPGFAAPEVAAGEPADGRSDLWSVGAVLRVALLGHIPAAASTADALTPEAALRIPEASDQHGPLDTIIWLATRRDPADRYKDATSMRGELARVAAAPGDQPVAGGATP